MNAYLPRVRLAGASWRPRLGGPLLSPEAPEFPALLPPAAARDPDRFDMRIDATLKNGDKSVDVRASIDTGMNQWTHISKKVADALGLTLTPTRIKPHRYYGEAVVDSIQVGECVLENSPVQVFKGFDLTGDSFLISTPFLGATNSVITVDESGWKLTCLDSPPPTNRPYVKLGTFSGYQGGLTVKLSNAGKSETFRAAIDTGMSPGATVMKHAIPKLEALGLGKYPLPEDADPKLKDWEEKPSRFEPDREIENWFVLMPKASIEGVADSEVREMPVLRYGWGSLSEHIDLIVGYDWLARAGSKLSFSKDGWAVAMGQKQSFLGLPQEAVAVGGVLVGAGILYALLS